MLNSNYLRDWLFILKSYYWLIIDVNGIITSDFGLDDGDCCFEFDPSSLWEQLNDILFSFIDFTTHFHDLVNE
jgi:hypothetical protein